MNGVCEVCGNPTQVMGLAGRPPKRCLEHRKNNNRDQNSARELLRKMSIAQTEERLRSQLTPVDAPPMRLSSPWCERLIAVCLSVEPDAQKAAEMAGLGHLSPEEITSLASMAGRHRDLAERKPGAVGAILSTAISLAAVRLAAQVDRLPASQLAANIRALGQALEMIQGSTTPAYSQIRLVVKAPDGSEWSPPVVAAA